MARLTASPVAQLELPDERKQGFTFENIPDGVMEIKDLTPGVLTRVIRANRPPGSALEITNGRIRDNWVGRRGAYTNYIAKPDSNLVMKFVTFHGEANKNWLLRVANGSTHATTTTTGWTALTGSDYSSFVRTTSAQMLGLLFLANTSKKIVKVDFPDLSFEEVSEAPVCKFVTTFADRLVAAYIHSPSDGLLPFGLQWSENADPLDWDGAGSGIENLVQSPSDTGDEITGIFGFGSVMIVLRERTIWHATRQPFQTSPMRFTPIITNQGCDMPYTAVRTTDEQGKLTGIIFADSQTDGIFMYTPGSRPQRLTERGLFSSLVDPQRAEGAFDPLNQEYHCGVPTDSSNLDRLGEYIIVSQNGGLVKDDSPTATTLAVVSDVGAPTLIDDLTGNIDDLSGTINDLGGVFFRPSIILKGGTAGEVEKEDLGTVGTHTLTWQSQDLGSFSRRRLLKFMTAVVSATADGNVVLQTSKDGSTWTTVKTKAVTSTSDKIGFRKGVTGDHIFWRLTTTAKEFRMFEWWAKILERGLKRQ